jgi:protoporphyrinogen IX oxidase
MLWIKAFHIIFVVTWFAGLFYLPRLFVYHAQTEDELSLRRFEVMERRLFAMMTIGAVLAAVFGFWLLFGYDLWVFSSNSLWLHLKLLLVLLLVSYHLWCSVLMQDLASGRNQHGPVWFRWFNEIPTVLLVLIILLAVVRPI